MTKDAINKFVKSLKGPDVKEIRSPWADFESPRKLAYKNTEKDYLPDAVVKRERGKDYYVIEKKVGKKDIPDLVAKWILFSMTARQNSGKFVLIVPKDAIDTCDEIIREKMLDIELKTL